MKLVGSMDIERPFFYYQHTELRAARKGKWKLHAPNNPNLKDTYSVKWLRHIAPEDRKPFAKYVLYDLEKDIGETIDVSAAHPKVVVELTKLLDWARKDIGDLNVRGENARTLGEEPYFTPNELILPLKK